MAVKTRADLYGQQDPCRPHHAGIGFCFVIPVREISPAVCLPGTPLSARELKDIVERMRQQNEAG